MDGISDSTTFDGIEVDIHELFATSARLYLANVSLTRAINSGNTSWSHQNSKFTYVSGIVKKRKRKLLQKFIIKKISLDLFDHFISMMIKYLLRRGRLERIAHSAKKLKTLKILFKRLHDKTAGLFNIKQTAGTGNATSPIRYWNYYYKIMQQKWFERRDIVVDQWFKTASCHVTHDVQEKHEWRERRMISASLDTWQFRDFRMGGQWGGHNFK